MNTHSFTRVLLVATVSILLPHSVNAIGEFINGGTLSFSSRVGVAGEKDCGWAR